MRRLRRITPLLAAGAVAAGLTGAAPGDRAGTAPPRIAAQAEAQKVAQTALTGLLWPGSPVPAARIDQAGQMLTPAFLRDKVVLVAFVNPDCLVTCVVRTLDLAKLAQALPERLRARTAFLAVDVDPDGGDGGELRRFAEGLGIAAAQMRLVTGDAAATAALIAALRYPAARLPEPPSTVMVFDRRGQLAMTYGSDPLDGPRLLRDIAQLDTFADGVGHPPRETADAAP